MEAIIILIVVGLQIWRLIVVLRNIQVHREIFSSKVECQQENCEILIGDNPRYYNPKSITVLSLKTESKNKTMQTICDSINQYLEKNAMGTADYHLMKDIVERNVDSSDETIHQQTPIPLYLGLMGTMASIIYGVLNLNLKELGATDASLVSMESLLHSIGAAMIASIVGIIMTTVITLIHRSRAEEVEEGKNRFLTMLQTELLPNMAGDIAGVMSRMVTQLTQFNQDFKENADHFASTLSAMNDETLGKF